MPCHALLSGRKIFSLIFVLFSVAICQSIETGEETNFQDGGGDAQTLPNDWAFAQMLQQENDKRNAWNKFHGSWGKREDILSDLQDDDSSQMDTRKRGKWSNLHGTWGKRIYGSNDGFYEDEQQSLQDVLSQLRGLNSAPVKREWAKFAGTWGKRPFASRTVSPRSTNWSSLRGSWGKRGDWAQLRGVWGKKADEVF